MLSFGVLKSGQKNHVLVEVNWGKCAKLRVQSVHKVWDDLIEVLAKKLPGERESPQMVHFKVA